MSMKSFLKWLFRVRFYSACNYTGRGYIQGIGFNVITDIVEIMGLQFVQRVIISTDPEWIRALQERLKVDALQQNREKSK